MVINNEDQTQVWGGFRVAKRAQIKNLKEGFDFVEAEHVSNMLMPSINAQIPYITESLFK